MKFEHRLDKYIRCRTFGVFSFASQRTIKEESDAEDDGAGGDSEEEAESELSDLSELFEAGM